MNGWIGVDLDGTLAHYDTWSGIEHIGEPVPAMVERVKKWLAEGREVRIFTARVSSLSYPERDGPTPYDSGMARRFIEEWCVKHIGQKLKVTNVKDYQMEVLYDDRARQVELNTGHVHGPDYYRAGGID